MIKKVTERFLTIFFPKHCAVCDAVLIRDNGICPECEKKLSLLSGNVCMICGKEIEEAKIYCYDCNRKQRGFERNFSVFTYSDMKESLYRFKYNGRAEYAKFYARTACRMHGRILKQLHADALVPIPLHCLRQRKRGYNQAEEFAKELSLLLDIPMRNDLIKRVKATKALKTLNAIERQNNLKKAFLFMQNDVKLNTIILVDDIFTTGATLDAAARVCKQAGVQKIYAVTIAVGAGLQDSADTPNFVGR
ncbi:MAG: ComF family protein [Lachnospiraceae bacterium]|nr:ComF family protein [Lachnospiraceae bacterium]